MENKNNKIALLYRVSSAPQEKDGSSLDVQQDEGRRVAKNLGLEYIEFNEGVQSSFKTEINHRPRLVELLNSIEKKDGIRKVWVINTDRLGRNSQSWYSILKIFIDYKVEIYIGKDANNPYDLDNSVDKLSFGILSLIAQYDNELRRARSILGKQKSIDDGHTYVGGTVPFGYKVKDKILIPDEKESKMVLQGFKMYDTGKSTQDIKLFFDKQSNISPRRSKVGWNIGTIQKMLRNPLYIGHQDWKWTEKLPNNEIKVVTKKQINVPKIVPKELWDSVQERIDKVIEQRLQCRENDRKSLLKGLLTCSKCKLHLGHRFKSNNHYYGRCKEYNWKSTGNKIDDSQCALKKSLRLEETNEKVLDMTIKYIRDSKTMREQYKIKNLSPKWEEDEKVTQKKKRLTKILRDKTNQKNNYEKELTNLEFEIRVGEYTKNDGARLIKTFNDRLVILKQEIEEVQASLSVLTNSESWVDWLESMNQELATIKSASLDKQKEFIHRAIRKIDVRYDEENQSHILDIYFKFPIVKDKLEYDGTTDKRGHKRYKIVKGDDRVNITVPLPKNKRSTREEYRNQLLNEIVNQMNGGGKSLQKICDQLNGIGMYSLNGEKWNKSKLSAFYRYHKDKVPKSDGVRTTITCQ